MRAVLSLYFDGRISGAKKDTNTPHEATLPIRVEFKAIHME